VIRIMHDIEPDTSHGKTKYATNEHIRPYGQREE